MRKPPPFLVRARTTGTPHDYVGRIPALAGGFDINLVSAVTILVGENGSGKSTVLEGIAELAGFNSEGGSRNHRFAARAESPALAETLRLTWRRRAQKGFFLRAESYFSLRSYLDDHGRPGVDGPLHRLSHGQSLLSLVKDRFKEGLFLLDEPEAALSPQHQLVLLRTIFDLVRGGSAQFVMATHSPLILAYPGATLLYMNDQGLREILLEEVPQFDLVRRFVHDPERYFKHLFFE